MWQVPLVLQKLVVCVCGEVQTYKCTTYLQVFYFTSISPFSVSVVFTISASSSDPRFAFYDFIYYKDMISYCVFIKHSHKLNLTAVDASVLLNHSIRYALRNRKHNYYHSIQSIFTNDQCNSVFLQQEL